MTYKIKKIPYHKPISLANAKPFTEEQKKEHKRLWEIKNKKVKEKKDYNVMYNVGKAKYVVNYYSGKKYKDGSKFYDIKIFKNKKKMEDFIKELK